MRAIGWTVALTVLLALPGPGHTAPVGFGPRTYLRTTGAPNQFTADFDVCRPERPFRLVVENGPGGMERVSSASLFLNGVEVVAESDLSQVIGRLDRAVRLTSRNSLTVTLQGTPLGVLAVSLVSEAGCLEVAIAAPPAGAAVPAGPLLVRGIVRGAADVGVTVNGAPAAVDGESFAAMIGVGAGDTQVQALATAVTGDTAVALVPLVVREPTAPPLVFAAKPPGGLAPLPVRFSLAPSGAVDRIRLDLRGLGAVDFEGASLDEQTFTYEVPGLYSPTVAVVDPAGVVQTAATLVHVIDRTRLDARLQARWTGMKDALRRGDVAGAVAAIAVGARETYRELLTSLTVPLDQIDRVLTDLTLLEADEFQAEYEMLRMDNGVPISHFVLFVRDGDGIWRIRFF